MNSFSALSLTQRSVLQTVRHFRQLTTSQLRRIHYRSGTPDGQRVRSCRHLKRLTELGYLKRMWGAYNGSAEYVYQLASTKARTPEPHTLDIAELYVQLSLSDQSENLGEPGSHARQPLTFLTEPWCHTRVGHVQLKPDAAIEIGAVSYWVEVDRGAEWESQLTAKMRRYVQAIDSGAWPADRAFPLVLWLVPDEARKRYLEDIIHKLGESELFAVVLFDDAARLLTERKAVTDAHV
ncbi:replication-relaxation family protein [Pseudarthrobacter sp. fls2-241-R2A-168]|uniref:replication-relaxation family protein n=1 Tax=Pseudarthrobacter sp. fls2-241-R2A-168 TaxID=3040304 RepID=UPI002556ED6B|nr:replication-relaxation family protein [Pseudarthrobacter sp. fls2-241-R2A-168]